MSECIVSPAMGSLSAGLENSSSATANKFGPREVVRCESCHLVQFRTVSDLCRRCYGALPRPKSEEAAAEDTAGGPASATARRIACPPELAVRGKTMRDFSLGRRLRELRESKNVTQAQIAVKAGVPRTYVSRIEHGHLLPGLGVVQRLADALSVELVDLITDGHSSGETCSPNDLYWSCLVRYFRTLQNDQKASVLLRVRAMVSTARASSSAPILRRLDTSPSIFRSVAM